MTDSIERKIRDYIIGDQEISQRYRPEDRRKLFPAASYSHIPVSQAKEGELGTTIRVAGRVTRHSRRGKLTFSRVQYNGEEIQIMATKDGLGDSYQDFSKGFREGDFVGVEGKLIETNTGELTVEVDSYNHLGKTIRRLPAKGYDEITDTETRVRRRHLDLLLNPESRERLINRSKINGAIRHYLEGEGFLEVETPILQPIYGGANARPFETTVNAVDNAKAFMRISNELYLKRLVMGGIERVFEFSKDFRNEGIDRTHNPEFTQLELYESFGDVYSMMDRARLLFLSAAQRLGKSHFRFMGSDVDLEGEWLSIPMVDSIREIGEVPVDVNDKDAVMAFVRENRIKVKGEFSYGTAINALFEEFVERHLINPTYIMDFPVEVSPLAKDHREKEGLVERFELYLGGKEFGNAYSELNDPIEQRRRFMQQQEMRVAGDDEFHPLDEDFLRTMEDGMPPMGGLGIGMDRVCMLFGEADNIRDVLFYPFMRPRN